MIRWYVTHLSLQLAYADTSYCVLYRFSAALLVYNVGVVDHLWSVSVMRGTHSPTIIPQRLPHVNRLHHILQLTPKPLCHYYYYGKKMPCSLTFTQQTEDVELLRCYCQKESVLNVLM